LYEEEDMSSNPGLDWERIHREATVIDMHIHPSLQQQLFRRNLNFRYVVSRTLTFNPFTVRASFPRLKDGGYDVILSAIYVPEKGILQDFPIVNLFRFLRPDLWHKLMTASPFTATISFLEDMEQAVASSTAQAPMKMARSAKELNDILSQRADERPIAVIHCVEGAHSLTGDQTEEAAVLQNLETLYQRGVAYLTLAHFYPNQVVNPCFPFPEDFAKLTANPAVWRDLTLGLTEIGQRVVERMIEMGMIIDLSHCTPTARRQIYDIVDASGKRVPLMASHVGAYEINPNPYDLSDWEVKRVARDGGVVGVIFMPYWLMPKETGQGINFISRTIEHLINVGGEDVVGIGTDFDGFTTPPDDLNNASQMPRLTQRLVVDGHSEGRIKKILGGNALRVLREGWGKKE
jgi:microsomal dipeptidase-like Zn-dependent dipeptidase